MWADLHSKTMRLRLGNLAAAIHKNYHRDLIGTRSGKDFKTEIKVSECIFRSKKAHRISPFVKFRYATSVLAAAFHKTCHLRRGSQLRTTSFTNSKPKTTLVISSGRDPVRNSKRRSNSWSVSRQFPIGVMTLILLAVRP